MSWATGSAPPLRAAQGPPGPPVRVERSVFLMGTVARFVAESDDRAGALARLETMVRTVEEVEAEISTWRADSHLGRANAWPIGEILKLPERPCRLLRRASAWWRETGGAFDPAVGGLMEAWGVAAGGRRPRPDEIAAARARADFAAFGFSGEACTITRVADVQLDVGAFGKGAALDEVGRALAGRPGPWLIDFGGQLAASADHWPVAIGHPLRREEAALELTLSGGSLATSGGSERDVTTGDGLRVGHIVDPRSGHTVVRDGSVTVWHPGALDADALSTALYVMGSETGLRWAAERGVAACFLLASGPRGEVTARATPMFRQRFGAACAGRDGAR